MTLYGRSVKNLLHCLFMQSENLLVAVTTCQSRHKLVVFSSHASGILREFAVCTAWFIVKVGIHDASYTNESDGLICSLGGHNRRHEICVIVP